MRNAAGVRPGKPRPIFLPPDSGRHFDFLGVTHRLTSGQSDGEYVVSGSSLRFEDAQNRIRLVLEAALRRAIDTWVDEIALTD